MQIQHIHLVPGERIGCGKAWGEFLLYVHQQCGQAMGHGVSDIEHQLSTAIAHFIVEVMEDRILWQNVQKEQDLRQEEQRKIFQYGRHFLYSSVLESSFAEQDQCHHLHRAGGHAAVTQKIQARKQYIYHQARLYLQESTEFHLDGFIYFRLKDYISDIRKAYLKALQEYELDQEYEYFIELLRFYFDQQTPLTPLIHVVHSEGQGYFVFDASGEYISLREILDQHSYHSASIHEDMLMTALMTLIPGKIELHTEDSTSPIVTTFKKVFNERVNHCPGCAKCSHWHKV